MRKLAMLVAAICAVAAATAGCGSSVDNSSSLVTALGLTFSGSYDVEIVPTTINGRPINPAAPIGKPATLRWVVQSTCAAPRTGCVAIAEPVDSPTPESLAVSGLEQPHMGFVFGESSWSRGVDPPAGVCISGIDGQPVAEPWSALHLTELQPTDTPKNDDPLPALTGSVTTVQGGTCSAVVNATITLTRTGDVPAGTPAPQRFDPKPADPHPLGATWRGTYEETTTPKSTTVGEISDMRSASSQFAATPVCTRDGARCMVVLSTQPATTENPPIFNWTGTAYERTSLAKPIDCAGGGTGVPHNIQHFVPVTPGTAPTDLAGTSTREITGDCSLTAVWDVAWRRTG